MPATKRIARLKMTTIISALVILSIILSVGAVSAAIFATLRQQALESGHAEQQVNLRIAATILERRLTNGMAMWTEDNSRMTMFRLFYIPEFKDTQNVDAVTRVTGQPAILYELDAATGNFVSRNSSLKSTDGTLVGLADITIPAGSAAAVGADRQRGLDRRNRNPRHALLRRHAAHHHAQRPAHRRHPGPRPAQRAKRQRQCHADAHRHRRRRRHHPPRPHRLFRLAPHQPAPSRASPASCAPSPKAPTTPKCPTLPT